MATPRSEAFHMASRKAMMHTYLSSVSHAIYQMINLKRVYTQTSTVSIMGATEEVYTFEPWTRVCGAPHV
jgi:hypothetical protein